MEVVGKIKFIGETIERGNFKARDIVITTDEQYPQHILVQFVQDKCEILNNYAIGQSVKISINLKGREWTNLEGRIVYFNTIQGWRIAKVQAEAAAPVQAPPMPAAAAFPPATSLNEEEPDDLPF